METEERLPAPGWVSPFERIRRTNAGGAQFWPGRNSGPVPGYSDYRNFEQAMKRAKTACFNSGQRIGDHFGETTETTAESIKKPKSKRWRLPEALEPPRHELHATDTWGKEDPM